MYSANKILLEIACKHELNQGTNPLFNKDK